MLIRICHKRISGRPVTLVVTLDADGAIMFWRSESESGEHVELSTADKWYALSAMHRAVAQMKRGAA